MSVHWNGSLHHCLKISKDLQEALSAICVL